jgi:hypothetical protein
MGPPEVGGAFMFSFEEMNLNVHQPKSYILHCCASMISCLPPENSRANVTYPKMSAASGKVEESW